MEMEPHVETMKSIRAQGASVFTASAYRCGCEYRQRWHLCAFHEGFEAGLECARTAPGSNPKATTDTNRAGRAD